MNVALLDSADVRLVTIVGPGAWGRPALPWPWPTHLQRRKPRPYADGIVFVDLTVINAAAAIVPAIADRLGAGSGRAPQRQSFAAGQAACVL
ncbi:MAG: hypothetical protein R2854_03605 [Caldilineaceae bacterium]